MRIDVLRATIAALLGAAVLTVALASQQPEASPAQQQTPPPTTQTPQTPPAQPPQTPLAQTPPVATPANPLAAGAPAAAPAQPAQVPPAQTPPVANPANPLAAGAPAAAPAQLAQVAPAQTPPVANPANPPAAAPAQPPQTPPAQTPPVANPPANPPVAAPAAAPAQPTTVPAQNAPQTTVPQGLDFQIPNGSLVDFIDVMAQHLKINYILDPAVAGKGSVSLFTYGEQKPTDLMTLLQTVLRVNSATIVKVGDIYRIVPINKISVLPLDPMTNVDQKTLPEDERMILDLIFLKYSTAKEIEGLIAPFLGEGASHSSYEPANLLIIQDNARSMARTLKLIDMFDSETFAGQRVRLFDITNGRPSDLSHELETVFKAYALSDKSSSVKFIPVDRINVIIAVAPNPGIFPQVKNWIDKLDVAVKVQAGEVSTYVYRLKYGRAETTALAITALYTGNVGALMSLAMMTQGGGMGMGLNGGMGGGYGGYGGMNYNSGYGGGGGGYGGYGGNMGGFGNLMGMSGMGGGNGYGGYGGGAYGGGGAFGNASIPPISAAQAGSASPTNATGPSADLSGSYLGLANAGGNGANGQRVPHIIPNPFDNTLLIQATEHEWQQINDLLRQIDIAPRQVLIEAKIYELDLNGAFSEGIAAYLEKKDTNATGLGRALNVVTSSSGLNLSLGALAGHAKEVLGVLQAQEHRDQSRVISAPSIIATDSVPAVMNVGEDVPVLTSEGVAGGVQSGGNSIFTNTVSNRSSGVTLSITAHVNSSGVVTMIIDQDVSSPQAPSTGGIQSPSFSRRSFSTQLTIQDGDTVAIGGFIQELSGNASDGVPFLHRIPILGGLFGSKSYSKGRTELIIFFTPRVLYDTNQVLDATEEIKSQLHRINGIMKDQ